MKITEPTLLLNKERCLKNIETVAKKAEKSGIIFRPHFKTHQSIVVGRWFRDFGVKKITVSSVKMAHYFASDGWDDITIAFPVNVLELDKINELASKIKLNIVVVDSEPIPYLLSSVGNKLGIFLKVDTGTHRTGIDPSNGDKIKEIIKSFRGSKNLEFQGFLAHSGHTYQARGKAEVEKIFNESGLLLNKLKKEYAPDCLVSVGDTPSANLMDKYENVDELRPGNFIFYDIMQLNIGSCSEGDIAVCMAAPIVVKHYDRDEVILYGGAVHLSKDFIIEKNGDKVFGYLVELNDKGWGNVIPGAFVKGMSQEHGIVKVNDKNHPLMKKNVGDLIGVLPVHSCLTADLLGRYLSLDGEIIEMMKK